MRIQSNHRHEVIDPTKPWHMTWWADQLDVSEDRLQDAMDRVGNDPIAVEAYLNTRRERRVGERRH